MACQDRGFERRREQQRHVFRLPLVPICDQALCVFKDARPERAAGFGFLCRRGHAFTRHLALVEGHFRRLPMPQFSNSATLRGFDEPVLNIEKIRASIKGAPICEGARKNIRQSDRLITIDYEKLKNIDQFFVGTLR
jgi:hypothetical protein